MELFFGITKDQWEIINGFANWFAAIGTIAAVIVSLCLASSRSKPKARLSAGPSQVVLLNAGNLVPAQKTFDMQVVNAGDRTFQVETIGWRIGGGRNSKFFIQYYDLESSSALPIKLAHGESATWRFQDSGASNWYVQFSKYFNRRWRSELLSFRFVVITSVGNEFTCKPNEEVLQRLEEELTALYGRPRFWAR